jgi:hypothetical protein
MRRSAMSIPNNLSEGCGCSTDLAFAGYVEYALRSACELEYQLFLSCELGFIELRPGSQDIARSSQSKKCSAVCSSDYATMRENENRNEAVQSDLRARLQFEIRSNRVAPRHRTRIKASIPPTAGLPPAESRRLKADR